MSSDDIVLLLKNAAAHIVPCPDGDPTTDGWATPESRRDRQTSIQTLREGVVTIAPAGLASFDRAVELLQLEPKIRDAWNAAEVGSVVASAVSAAAFSDNVAEHLESWLVMIREVWGSLVVFPVANVAWGKASMSLGDREGELVAIGDLNDKFVDRLTAEASRFFLEPLVADWVEKLKTKYAGTPMPAVFAARVRQKGERGVSEAMRLFATLIQVAVLFMKHASPEHCRTCANANRPGPRGSMLDRTAIEHRLGGDASSELSAQILSLSLPRFWDRSHWNHADPLPLGVIMHTSPIGAAVTEYLYTDGPISERIRLAARWFSEAYWSRDGQDAALALGISLEALAGSPTAFGGSALAERYSALEPDAERRDERAREFRTLWKIRNKMAHGARGTEIDNSSLKRMEDAVYWAARRYDELKMAFNPTSEADLDRILAELRGGALAWPPTRKSSA